MLHWTNPVSLSSDFWFSSHTGYFFNPVLGSFIHFWVMLCFGSGGETLQNRKSWKRKFYLQFYLQMQQPPPSLSHLLMRPRRSPSAVVEVTGLKPAAVDSCSLCSSQPLFDCCPLPPRLVTSRFGVSASELQHAAEPQLQRLMVLSVWQKSAPPRLSAAGGKWAH